MTSNSSIIFSNGRSAMQIGRVLLALGLLLLSLTSCSTTADPERELTLFAAASLTDAFGELASAFEASRPNTTVRLNFAGSSQLSAQLREGAPADLFASANPDQIDGVVAAGRITPGSITLFAANRLTLITPTDNPAAIAGLADLARPGVQIILATRGVPIRAYTDQLVGQQPAPFQTAFQANVVSEEENVRQVIAKIALGEADAALVYASDVTPDMAVRVAQLPLPEAESIRATYPIAPLVDAAEPELATAFIDFVLSQEGQAILAKWGFEPLTGKLDTHLPATSQEGAARYIVARHP